MTEKEMRARRVDKVWIDTYGIVVWTWSEYQDHKGWDNFLKDGVFIRMNAMNDSYWMVLK